MALRRHHPLRPAHAAVEAPSAVFVVGPSASLRQQAPPPHALPHLPARTPLQSPRTG